MQFAPSLSIMPECPELGTEVPVGEIDRELRKLWDQDEARTNASLMNLVVYSEQPGSLLENSAIIRDLTREHACRAILVEIDRRETVAGIRAWITAHCHLSHGQKSVCCEQIAFYLTGTVTGRFRNTVFAHLNADLPLVFWWQGELSDILTERLVAVVDRLIIDSSHWSDPAASLRRIETSAQSNPDLILQDHEWTRSWQFRVGIASLFDDPTAQRMLPEIERVQIIHHPAHRNAALQILAWLATQSGWQDAAAGCDFIGPNGHPILVSLEQAGESAPPLARLELQAGDARVWISHEAGSPHLERSLEAPGYRVCSLAPADPDSAADLLTLQLARGGKNTLFRKILPRYRAMLERLT